MKLVCKIWVTISTVSAFQIHVVKVKIALSKNLNLAQL